MQSLVRKLYRLGYGRSVFLTSRNTIASLLLRSPLHLQSLTQPTIQSPEQTTLYQTLTRMSPSFAVTEPHPSVSKGGAYLGGGIGGAGNYKRFTSEELSHGPHAVGPASRVSLTARPAARVMGSGRGGSGNFRRTDSEPRMFQLDEEMVKRRESHAPVYHIGRGGGGNFVRDEPQAKRTGSASSAASVNTQSSAGSSVRQAAHGAMGMLRKLKN